MRLIAFKKAESVQIGVIAPSGRVTPLAPIDEFYGNVDQWLSVARMAGEGTLATDDLQQVPAVPASARIFCVGLNYHAHAEEAGQEASSYPVLFGRWHGSLTVDSAPIPALEENLDWEGELAVVIRAKTSRVSETDAMRSVLGYAAFNDITCRSYQFHTNQWTLGKNGDASGPMGLITTSDQVPDLTDGLSLTTRLNGEVVQQTSTSRMIHNVPRLISYISEIVTLQPGDVIATGTPGGVGFALSPQRFMKAGDVIEVEIEKVGLIRNRIVARGEWEKFNETI